MRLPREYTATARYLAIATALFLVLYFGGRGLVGLVIYSPIVDLTKDVGASFAKEDTYLMDMQGFGTVTAVNIDGSFTGAGKAIVSLEVFNKSQVIVDTSSVRLAETTTTTNASGNLLTGLVVAETVGEEPPAEETPVTETPSTEETSVETTAETSIETSSTAETTSTVEQTTTSSETSTTAETSTTTGATTPVANETSTTAVTTTTSGGGGVVETTTTAAPTNQTTSSIPVTNATTSSITNTTTTTAPISNITTTTLLNTTINVTSTTINATTTSQPTTVKTTTTSEVPPIIPSVQFSQACNETCSVKFNASVLKLVVKIIGDGELKIDRVHYRFSKISKILPPAFVRPIPDIIMEENKSFSLILTDYFSGNNLSYSFDTPPNIGIRVEKGKVYFTPKKSYSGVEQTTLYATNPDGTARSNLFSIRVKKFVEEELLTRLKNAFPYLSFIEVSEANKLYTVVYEVNNSVVRIQGLQNVTKLKNISIGDVGEIKIG